MENEWNTIYHKYFVPIVLPVLSGIAFLNNMLIIFVATLSYRFKQATFISMRFFIVCLALLDIIVVIFSRGPIISGVFAIF